MAGRIGRGEAWQLLILAEQKEEGELRNIQLDGRILGQELGLVGAIEVDFGSKFVGQSFVGMVAWNRE